MVPSPTGTGRRQHAACLHSKWQGDLWKYQIEGCSWNSPTGKLVHLCTTILWKWIKCSNINIGFKYVKASKWLLPCIVPALRVIPCIIEKSPEVNKDWAWSVRGNQMSLHFLWRSIGWDNDRTLLQTDMIFLSKSLNQSSTSQQWKNSTLNSLFFLQTSIQLLPMHLLRKKNS